MGRSRGDPEQPVGNSGCCMKAARAGISLNNNYSYCLLSTYCLPKTAQSAFHTSNLLVLLAAPCEDGQTEDQRSQATCPSSHNQSVAGQESNPASSNFIAWVSRNISRITDIPPLTSVLSHLPQPHPIRSLNRGWFCLLWCTAPFSPSVPLLGQLLVLTTLQPIYLFISLFL